MATRESKDVGLEDAKTLIHDMIEDIKREGEGEVEVTKAVSKAIGTRTVKLLKVKLESSLNDRS